MCLDILASYSEQLSYMLFALTASIKVPHKILANTRDGKIVWETNQSLTSQKSKVQVCDSEILCHDMLQKCAALCDQLDVETSTCKVLLVSDHACLAALVVCAHT